jgi:hypothetical protein
MKKSRNPRQKLADKLFQLVGKKKYHPKEPKQKRKCQICSKLFFAYSSEVRRGGAKFCNRKCWIEYTKKPEWKPCLGKHWKHTKEYKKKLSLARMGEKNPMFISGLSRKHRGKTQRLKNWRLKVFRRDNFTCRECSKRQGDLNAHHIIFWAESPKDRFRVSNGVTLCVNCHKYIHRFERFIKKTTQENKKVSLKTA